MAWISTGYGIVEFNVTEGVITEITDSTGGTASDTIANTAGANPTTAEFENAIASLTAKVNQLIRRLGN